jgi:hypothetical protein
MAESNRQRRLFPDAFKLEAVAAIRGGGVGRGCRARLAGPSGTELAALGGGPRDGWERRAAWARAQRIRLRRLRDCGVNSIACGWSVTS